MTGEAIWDWVLGWLVRLAGLFWLVGAFMLFRQIRMEMALDRMASRIAKAARNLEAGADGEGQPEPRPDPRPIVRPEDGHGVIDAPAQRRARTTAEKDLEAWMDRDDAARRGWIAGQAVVLAGCALAMMALHPLASYLVALLVMGQGVYFVWRERTARRAPTPEAATHARPSAATINAGWVSLIVGCLVWMAAFRGILR